MYIYWIFYFPLLETILFSLYAVSDFELGYFFKNKPGTVEKLFILSSLNSRILVGWKLRCKAKWQECSHVFFFFCVELSLLVSWIRTKHGIPAHFFYPFVSSGLFFFCVELSLLVSWIRTNHGIPAHFFYPFVSSGLARKLEKHYLNLSKDRVQIVILLV